MVIVWEDFRSVYTNFIYETDIYARLFNADDSPLGLDFRVDQNTGSADAVNPNVAAMSDGSFFVTWADERGGDLAIYGRPYDSSGAPASEEFAMFFGLVGPSSSLRPRTVFSENGDMAIAWSDSCGAGSCIYAYRCCSFGEESFRVDQGSAAAAWPQAAFQFNGNLLFAWRDNRNGSNEIFANLWGDWTDADGDGLPDLYEQRYSCLQANTADAGGNPDGDGYPNLEEFNNATDPCLSDCADGDGDGFGPGCLAGPDCDDADPDNWISCASCADGDADAYFSGCDAYAGRLGPDCDDADAAVFPAAPELCDCRDNQCPGDAGHGVVDEGCTPDADCDGLPDDWENQHDCMKVDQKDRFPDYDSDELTNGEEYGLGTDPCKADTDDDDLEDGEELDLYGTNPLKRDTDGDRYDDGTEVKEGTDPLDPASYPKNPAPKDVGLDSFGGESAGCGQLAEGPGGAGLMGIGLLIPGLLQAMRRFRKHS
jgi:hypothetical protein